LQASCARGSEREDIVKRTVFPATRQIEYGLIARGRTIEPVLKVDARNAAGKHRGEALA